MNNNEISGDFPFQSKYLDVLGSKMHYVEEGQGDPILFCMATQHPVICGVM